MKLLSMTSFIEEQEKIILDEIEYAGTTSEDYKAMVKFITNVTNYSKFLRQPLTFGMFVPVEETGNVLGFPSTDQYGYYNANHPEEQSGWMYEEGESKYHEALEKWTKAQEKVMFEGVKIINKDNFFLIEDTNGYWLRVVKKNTSTTVEDLLKLTIVQLTPSALKHIGL